MAINSQKLLPQSKIGSSTSVVKVGKMIPTLYKRTQELKPQSGEDSSGAIVLVKKQVVDISRIVSDSTLLRKKSQEQDRKETESKKRGEKENRLEGKKGSGLIKALVGSIPQLGFLDAINRFITFTLLGWAFKNLYPYLPQILEFTKNIKPIINFFETLSVNFFKGVVDFIDLGYKAYDQVRGFTKSLGGEPFQKAFDDFSKNLNTFINLALVAGILATGGPDFSKKGPRGKSGNVSRRSVGGQGYRYDPKRALIRRKYGDSAAKLYDLQIEKGKSAKQAIDLVEGRYIKKGRITPQRMSSLAEIKGSNLLGRGFGRAPRRLMARVLGRSGSRVAKGIFARIPIIGGLIDFAISLAMGEKPGRAAARAVGASLGSILGTFVPVPFAGTILGGILGDIVGGALYDTLVTDKPKKMAGGGKVTTRKGKVVGGRIKRSVRKIYTIPRAKSIKSGASVGGEQKLKKLFPEPPRNQIGKMMNPYGFLTNTAKRFGEIPVVGSIFNIFGKVLKGDMPTKDDYRVVGDSFNAWINNAITKGLLQGNLMSAFADGGVIDVETQMKRDISGWVEKSVEELVKNKVTAAINEMRKNLGLKPLQEFVSGQDVTDQAGELGSASDAVGGARLLMAAGFPMLAAAILSGNIQQESGWNGQRTPWVLNDGAGTNKGLISWNQSRIANAEKFLGKPLETATNAEQVKWIKEELRQYGLLDEFMDPNRTEEQLKADSYSYIRWGHEGKRWSYSKQIFSALQKGERGTYTPLTSSTPTGMESSGWAPLKSGLFNAVQYITGDRSHPNFELKGHGMRGNYHDHIAFRTVEDKERAKRALRAANIQIGSEFRSGAPGYHGRNLAIDIPGSQWDGSGAIGKKEFDGSKKVRAVLGLKDGGEITDQRVKPLQKQASYEYEETRLAILPIIIEKEVPIQTNNRLGLNSKYSSRVPM